MQLFSVIKGTDETSQAFLTILLDQGIFQLVQVFQRYPGLSLGFRIMDDWFFNGSVIFHRVKIVFNR